MERPTPTITSNVNIELPRGQSVTATTFDGQRAILSIYANGIECVMHTDLDGLRSVVATINSALEKAAATVLEVDR